MKFLIHLILTGLLVFPGLSTISWAQDTTSLGRLIFFAPVKQVGIYRTFEEFRNNAPSIAYTPQVVYKEEIISIFTEGFTAYKLELGDSLPCPKNTAVWGFCDGNNVYVSRSAKFGKRNVYDKMIFFGRYCYYQSTVSYSRAPMMIPAGGGAGGPMMMGGGGGKTVMDFIIDANTGKINQVSKKVFKNIMINDQPLYERFQKERKRGKLMASYIIHYAKNHVNEIKP